MGGDYTRWNFNPAKDYCEVFKQQGRVDLDADWNEFVEIMNRRWRAETMDIIGRAVVPSFTRRMPSTSIRRDQASSPLAWDACMWTGLLAECHGVSPLLYDATLGEVNGSAPVPFNQQPYFPNPAPLPSTGPAVDLIYLDVWQREVTALQDPAIREKALGGPDTTTRMQTVWQVKILPNVGAHSCGDKSRMEHLIAPFGWTANDLYGGRQRPARSLHALSHRRLSRTGEPDVSSGSACCRHRGRSESGKIQVVAR